MGEIHKEESIAYTDKEKKVGIKHDEGKLRYDLFPVNSMEGIAEVLTFGANKYSDENWKNVEKERYLAGCFRHIQAYRKGEELDKESGLHHLYHAISCLIFIKELEDLK